MHLVVVRALPGSIEAGITRLAARQQTTLYEARTRLAGELPRIVAVLADARAAEQLARELAQDGFAALALDGGDIVRGAQRDHASTLSLGPDALEAQLRGGASRTIAYADLALVLHGVGTATETRTTEESVRKFSPGRALLTGGIVLTKTLTTTTTQTHESREGFLYLYEAHGTPPLALHERRVNYGFLGAALQPSSRANLLTVLAELRRRAPHARVDDRLVRPVAFGALPLPPPGADRDAWRSDVAAALLSLDVPRARAT